MRTVYHEGFQIKCKPNDSEVDTNMLANVTDEKNRLALNPTLQINHNTLIMTNFFHSVCSFTYLVSS